MELVAPTVGGVIASDGSVLGVHHKIDGGPSVVFDAVALLVGDEAAALALAKLPPARDFVADAYAHYKFVGFTAAASGLFAKAGLPEALDDGFIQLKAAKDAKPFVTTLARLRFWDRTDAA